MPTVQRRCLSSTLRRPWHEQGDEICWKNHCHWKFSHSLIGLALNLLPKSSLIAQPLKEQRVAVRETLQRGQSEMWIVLWEMDPVPTVAAILFRLGKCKLVCVELEDWMRTEDLHRLGQSNTYSTRLCCAMLHPRQDCWRSFPPPQTSVKTFQFCWVTSSSSQRPQKWSCQPRPSFCTPHDVRSPRSDSPIFPSSIFLGNWPEVLGTHAQTNEFRELPGLRIVRHLSVPMPTVFERQWRSFRRRDRSQGDRWDCRRQDQSRWR